MVGVLAHAAIAAYERFTRHATTNANQAAAFLGTVRLGPFQPWRDGLIIGVVCAVALAFAAPAFAFAAVLLGLYLYEWAYVRAGQLPPLS